MSADGASGDGAGEALKAERRARVGMPGPAFAAYWLTNPEAIPPSSRLLGCRPLEADPERGFARSAFDIGMEFCNPTGAVQGGFVAAMLDDTMAIGGLTKIGGGHFLPTLEMKLNYTRPSPPGELFAEGWLVHAGKSIAFLEGRLLNPDGELCATSTATALIRAFKRETG